MAEIFSNLGKETNIHIQEVQKFVNNMNSKRHISRHIIVKMSKVKNKNRVLKAPRKKQHIIYKDPYKDISRFFSTNFRGLQKRMA